MKVYRSPRQEMLLKLKLMASLVPPAGTGFAGTGFAGSVGAAMPDSIHDNEMDPCVVKRMLVLPPPAAVMVKETTPRLSSDEDWKSSSITCASTSRGNKTPVGLFQSPRT